LYIQGLDAGIPVCDEEILTQIEQANERIMTSLRQRQGLQLDLFSAEIGEELFALFLQNAQSDIVSANTETIDGTMRLTSTGIMLADAVISTLFLDA
jgi:coproporphyrinogen III oxidase-like Fe-S oxidoreductase